MERGAWTAITFRYRPTRMTEAKEIPAGNLVVSEDPTAHQCLASMLNFFFSQEDRQRQCLESLELSADTYIDRKLCVQIWVLSQLDT